MSIVVTQLGRTITQTGNILGNNGFITGQQSGGLLSHLFGPDRRYEGMQGGDSQFAESTDNQQIRNIQQQREQIIASQKVQKNSKMESILHRLSTPGLSLTFEDKIDLAKQKIQNIKSKQLKNRENTEIDKKIKDKKKDIKQSENEESKGDPQIQRLINSELEQHKKDLEHLESQKQKITQKKEESKSIIQEFNNHLQDKKDVHLMDLKNKSKQNNPNYNYEKIQDLVNKMNENNISGYEQDRILSDIQRNGLREFWQYPRYDQRYKLLKPKEEQIIPVIDQVYDKREENKEQQEQHIPNPLNNHEDLNIQQQQADNTTIQRQQEVQHQNQNQNPNPNNPGGNPYDPNNEMPHENRNFKGQLIGGIMQIAQMIYDHNTGDKNVQKILNNKEDMSNFYKFQISNVLNDYTQTQQNSITNLFNKISTNQVHDIIHLEPEEIMSQYVDYY